jgi:hypothetical protein
MGKWISTNALRCANDLDRTKRAYKRLLFLFNYHKRLTTKSKHTVKYLNLSSAKRPVPQSAELPVPTSSTPLESEEIALSQGGNNEHDRTFELSSFKEPHLLTQCDLNDLVRDLHLSKKQAVLLRSRC